MYIFGLSILTKYHLEILFLLSDVIDIEFFLLNPAAEEYWGDVNNAKDVARWKSKGYNVEHVSIGNDLLTSWGKVLQNTFRLLFLDDNAINAYHVLESPIIAKNTLLGIIQTEIEQNIIDEARTYLSLEVLQDESIVINSNYTLIREVEVLYQHLLYLRNDKQLDFGTRDVIVMVQDIDTYTPYIKAVFDNALISIKYKIADETLENSYELFGFLKDVLLLEAHTLSNHQVVQLVTYNFIRSRFGLPDVNNIKQLLKDTNIIMGVQGSQEDESYLVSWEYGIRRMLLGICIADTPILEMEGKAIQPIDTIEGKDAASVMAFCSFMKFIIDFLNRRNSQRTPLEWMYYIEQFFQTILDYQYSEQEDWSELLQKIIDQYKLTVEIIEEKVPYEVFVSQLLSVLSSETKQSGFLGRGITFCSLVPMRSIPFDIVCMLGLNYDNFPRKEKSLSFNLLQQKAALGDRNVKDSDKHLFLETLLSCKQHLYLSYLGKSLKDNNDLPPTILIDELLSYIQKKAPENVDVRSILVTQHPLYSFNKKYNNTEYPKLTHFSAPDVNSKRIDLLTDKVTIDPFTKNTLAANEVLNILSHPIRYFMQQQLNVYYKDDTIQLNDSELFEIPNFEKLAIQKDLFTINDEDISLYAQHKKLEGSLPLKNMGSYEFQQQMDAIAIVKTMFHEQVDTATFTVENIAVLVDDITFNAQYSNVHEGIWYYFYTGNKLSNRLFFELYIYGLLARSHKFLHEIKIYHIQSEKLEPLIINLNFWDVNYCKQQLSLITDWIRRCHVQLIPYFYKFNNAKLDTLAPIEQISVLMENNLYPLQDAYVLNMLNDIQSIKDKSIYIQFCKDIVYPMIEMIEKPLNEQLKNG